MVENNAKQEKKVEEKGSFIVGLLVGFGIFSIIIFVVLTLFVLFANNNTNSSSDEKVDNTPAVQDDNGANKMPEPKIKQPTAIRKTDHIWGNPKAKVTVIEYSDFECPFCARHYSTMKELKKNYNGKIKVVFRHFPLSFHEHAMPAAVASECASDQGKFWEMYDKLFEANQSGKLSEDGIFDTLAKELKLDIAKFDACIKSGKKEAIIKEDMKLGTNDGVQGTPGTFVNDKFVSGAFPYSYFADILDKELAK